MRRFHCKYSLLFQLGFSLFAHAQGNYNYVKSTSYLDSSHSAAITTVQYDDDMGRQSLLKGVATITTPILSTMIWANSDSYCPQNTKNPPTLQYLRMNTVMTKTAELFARRFPDAGTSSTGTTRPVANHSFKMRC